jgi:NifB/MoaA-like Fe-S oxidoreductase
VPFPPAEQYDGFEQVENGVGAVRYLEQLVRDEAGALPDLAGRRVLVLTGTAMGPLMPFVLAALERYTGARFECVTVENSYYGATVTTAGLLPGADLAAALGGRTGYDLALLPAEAVNEDGVFVDDVSLAAVVAGTDVPVRLSYHFTDALGVEAAA